MFFACIFVLNLTSQYEINASAESITLSSWLSWNALGDEIEGPIATGDQVFVNYKLTNSSGNLVGRENDCPVQFRIYTPDGNLYDEYTYNYSDNDYLGFVPEEAGIWSYEIETSNWVEISVSGDIRVIPNSVDIETWVSDAAYGGAHTTFRKGDGVYVCYKLYETKSKEKLGDECEFNVTISITTPRGETVSDSSTDSECYFGVYTDWYGTYSYKIKIDGDYEATQTGTFECVKLNEMDYNTDVWNFENDYDCFTDNKIKHYFINDKYWKYYIDNHDSLIDISRALSNSQNNWGGSCFGMSTLLVLNKQGAMNSSELPDKPGSLRSAARPITKLDLLSLINYYQLTQYDTVFRNLLAEYSQFSDEIKIHGIIKYCERHNDDGRPALLCFDYGDLNNDGEDEGGHAVVAYGIETNDSFMGWRYDFKKYDTRIKIYDPNSVESNERLFLYINSENLNWVIPGINATQDNTSIDCFTADTDVLNYNGCVGNRSNYKEFLKTSDGLYDGSNFAFNQIDYENFNNVTLTTTNYGSNFHITNKRPSIGTSTGGYLSSVKEITEYYTYSNSFGDSETSEMNIVLPDTTSCYTMNLEKADNIDFSLRYEDTFYSVECDNGSSVSCDPDGTVQIDTNGSDCIIELVNEAEIDDAILNNIKLSSTGNENCILQKTGTGKYQFTASSLSNIEVSVVVDYSTGEYITASISEPKYKKLSIEINEETKEIKFMILDKLTIEIPTDSNLQGDVNLDGTFSVADVVMLQKWLLCAGSLSKWENADLCKDGKINVFDLCLMKRALIESRESQRVYWVIFEEGYRGNRVELSKVSASSDAKIIYDGKRLKVDQEVTCYQYYYDDITNNWIEIGTYGILTDYAYSILASNVDIYDENGNVVFVKNSDTYTDYSVT